MYAWVSLQGVMNGAVLSGESDPARHSVHRVRVDVTEHNHSMGPLKEGASPGLVLIFWLMAVFSLRCLS